MVFVAYYLLQNTRNVREIWPMYMVNALTATFILGSWTVVGEHYFADYAYFALQYPRTYLYAQPPRTSNIISLQNHYWNEKHPLRSQDHAGVSLGLFNSLFRRSPLPTVSQFQTALEMYTVSLIGSVVADR